jgi:hypothetical protein
MNAVTLVEVSVQLLDDGDEAPGINTSIVIAPLMPSWMLGGFRLPHDHVTQIPAVITYVTVMPRDSAKLQYDYRCQYLPRCTPGGGNFAAINMLVYQTM